MLESLTPFLAEQDEVVILAMDNEARDVLMRLARPGWKIIGIDEFEDKEVLALREERPFREFCWTCTPALSSSLVRNSSSGDKVIYLDADLVFYRDPRELIGELGSEGNILIHEHRYSEEMRMHERGSGRFNVGLVAFRVGDEARSCVERWRRQVIERCELDPENGYCGDQGYLNEWPSKYRGLKILQNIGGGVAPWNVGRYAVDEIDALPSVNGAPIVFFHFHSLEMAIVRGLGLIAVNPAKGYRLSRETRHIVYRDYARRLRRMVGVISRLARTPRNEVNWNYRDTLNGVLRGRYVSAI